MLLRISLLILCCLAPLPSAWAEDFATAVFSREADLASLRFKIRIMSRCMFGDMDAVFLDLMRSESKRLLLSIESLAETADFEGASLDLFDGIKSMQDGYHTQLKLSPPKAPLLAAIFICKDSAASGVCRDKPAIDINQVIRTYKVGNEPGAGYQPPDKIYFFKPILIEPAGSMFPNQAMNSRRYADFRLLLDKKRALKPGKSAEWEQALSIGSTMQNMPLGYESNEIVISLPAIDPEKCGNSDIRMVDLEKWDREHPQAAPRSNSK